MASKRPTVNYCGQGQAENHDLRYVINWSKQSARTALGAMQVIAMVCI